MAFSPLPSLISMGAMFLALSPLFLLPELACAKQNTRHYTFNVRLTIFTK